MRLIDLLTDYSKLKWPGK